MVTALYYAVRTSLQRRREKDLDGAAAQSGAERSSDARLPMDRILPLLQPLDFTKANRVYQWSMGGYDAFVIQWMSVVLVANEPRLVGFWHAYLVLGCGGPHLRAYPKGIFGKPSGCVRVAGDHAFSRRFHVQAQDADTARWYLGPALRRFLLAQPAAWSFHAEPSGVALVAGGKLSEPEARSMRTVLEKLLAAAEPTRIS